MKKTAPIPFVGSQPAESGHVCAFFNSDDEAYRMLEVFERLASGNLQDGFPLSRIVYNMEWATGGDPKQFLREFRERRAPCAVA